MGGLGEVPSLVPDPSDAAVGYNLGTPLMESYISPSHAAVGYKL